jgi:peptide-methionine (S)-S-oxide reductase
MSRRYIHLLQASVCAVAAVAVLGLAAGFGIGAARGADLDQRVPAPALDETVKTAGTETLILAGGCFWGVQGVFQHVRGVTNAVAGYDGGSAATAQYETVSTGTTGHAESVRITYDPRVVTFGRLLQIYFSVTTDPTQRNRQYPDEGPQYRSEIFATTPEQAAIAQAYIAQLGQAHVFPRAIVTEIGKDTGFYPAEDYHQNYLAFHPDSPYIATFDLPKLAALKKVFPEEFMSDPVLVTHTDS